MIRKHAVRAGGPTQTPQLGDLFDGWAGTRFRTLRVRTWRRLSGELLNAVDGAAEFVLYTRVGDVERQRSFHLGALEELTIDVSQATDATLNLKADDLAGYDVLAILDTDPPVGHVDAYGRFYERRAGAGDFPVPAGAVSVGLSAVDGGWRWLGRSVVAGVAIVVAEPATYLGGTVKGFGFRSTVAPLDLAWTVAL